jgi:hypothetical protein
MKRAVAFAGPSIFGIDPALLGGLELRPPAGRGDLLLALADGATAIGLIDGVFDTQPAVWHKEILYALQQRVPVLGAASMGALRAAECAAFGMIGVGGIYEEYANGTRVADADMGVAHAPVELGYQPITVALVDVEATLHSLHREEGVDARLRDRLLQRARTLHFKARTWEAILDDEATGLLDQVLAHPSRKTADAVLLLERMRGGRLKRPAPFALNLTGYLANLADELGIELEFE